MVRSPFIGGFGFIVRGVYRGSGNRSVTYTRQKLSLFRQNADAAWDLWGGSDVRFGSLAVVQHHISRTSAFGRKPAIQRVFSDVQN